MTRCETMVNGEMVTMIKFEIFIDEETFQAAQTGSVPWCSSPNYRCSGLDPVTFPRILGICSTVPFKKWHPEHTMAADGFARAFRKKHVTGLPVYLIEAMMHERAFIDHVLAGDLLVNATMLGTVGFTRPVDQNHFPTLVVDVTKRSPEQAQEMLDSALLALE